MPVSQSLGVMASPRASTRSARYAYLQLQELVEEKLFGKEELNRIYDFVGNLVHVPMLEP